MKMIKITVSTGFPGAEHEEEIVYKGQTEEEIKVLVEEFREEVCCNCIEAEYEIIDEEE